MLELLVLSNAVKILIYVHKSIIYLVYNIILWTTFANYSPDLSVSHVHA